MPGGGLQKQFDGRYPQHGRAFLTTGFVAAAFEGGRRGLLCSRAFLYSLCFTLLYRLRTCFGLILRNLFFLCLVKFFDAWLSCFLFLGCWTMLCTRGGAGGLAVPQRLPVPQCLRCSVVKIAVPHRGMLSSKNEFVYDVMDCGSKA